jgi:hypothetical protein
VAIVKYAYSQGLEPGLLKDISSSDSYLEVEMTYDRERNVITVGENSDFLEDSGVYFLYMMKKIVEESSTATALQIRDFGKIKKWLGCEGRDITKLDEEKMAKAWKAYLAMGKAPSITLQPTFDYFSEKYKNEGYSPIADRAPSSVYGVFMRMMASDDEIKLKREYNAAQFIKTDEGKKTLERMRVNFAEVEKVFDSRGTFSILSFVKSIFSSSPKAPKG